MIINKILLYQFNLVHLAALTQEVSDILAKVFSCPSMRMWKFSKPKDYEIAYAHATVMLLCPFLGKYSISCRVWSISIVYLATVLPQPS